MEFTLGHLITAGSALPIARAAGGRRVDWASNVTTCQKRLAGKLCFVTFPQHGARITYSIFVTHLGNLHTFRFLPLSRTYSS